MLVEVPCHSDPTTPTADCRAATSDEQRVAGCGQFDHFWLFQADEFETPFKKYGWDCCRTDKMHDHAGDVGDIHESWAIVGSAEASPAFFCQLPRMKGKKEGQGRKK